MKNRWPDIEKSRSNLLIAGIVFVCLWFFVRSYNVYPSLFLNTGETRLTGVDSYFHLRHAEAVYKNYPHIMRHDPYSAYPSVENGLNQGLYDVMVATLAKLSFGLLSCKDIMFFLSPTLTALAFCTVGAWLWQTVSPWAGILFWTFICLYPGALVQVSALGNGDHHSFEVCMSTFLILSLYRALQDSAPLWAVVVPAILLQILFFGWAGAALHLFFVGICFYLVALLQSPGANVARLRNKGVLFGLLTVLIPFTVARIDFDAIIWEKSLNVFLGCDLALTLGYPLLLWLAPKLTSRQKFFLTLVLVVGVPFLAKLNPAASAAFDIFFGRRPETIAEHANINLINLLAWFGIGVFALITTPIVLARRGKLAQVAVPVAYGLGLTLFWFHTLDFGYYGPGVIAAFAAYSVSQLPWKAWTPVVLALLFLPPLLPIPRNNRPWMKTSALADTVVHSNGLNQAAHWLRTYRETEGKGADYGLLGPWDWGSILAELTDTPVGFSETNSYRLAQIFYDTRPEGDLEAIDPPQKPFRFIVIPVRNLQEKFGTELVVSGREATCFLQKGPTIQWEGMATEIPVPNATYYEFFIVRLFDLIAQNMSHYRMVFESPQQTVRAIKLQDNLAQFEFASPEVTDQEAEALRPILGVTNKVFETSRGLLLDPRLSPEVRVFEVVPGALFTGKTKPHTKVSALLTVTAPYNGIPNILTWTTESDEKGEFALRVPYATGGPTHPVPGSTVTSGAYRVDVAGKTYELKVSEAQVQSEGKIPVQ